MAVDGRYFDFEDAPIEDFDSAKAGDEVAYEDEQQEMFEHYRFDISSGQVPMRVDKYLATHMEYTSRHRIQLAIKAEYTRSVSYVRRLSLGARRTSLWGFP